MESRPRMLLVSDGDGPIWLDPRRPSDVSDRDDDRAAAGRLRRLLAPVLGSAAGEAAASLIAELGELERVLTASRPTLLSMPHMTSAAVDVIVGMRDIRQSIAAAKLKERTQVLNAAAAATILRELVPDATLRWVGLLLLDGADRLTRSPVVWMGTLDETPLYPREIARQALTNRARSAVIAVGSPEVEQRLRVRDQEQLRRTFDALNAIEVGIHDTMLVRQGDVQSLADALSL